MMTCELAINEDGDPFSVPPQIKGWKVRRASERRGRPALIHEGGKPLILRADATHTDLLAAAGPGRYRLEAVDENRRKIEGVPQAWTGPLTDDEDDDTPGDDDREDMMAGSAVRRPRMEDVLCQMLANQTRMVEATLGQMGTVMAGVAGLLHTVHQTGVVHQVPPQVAVSPAPPPVPPPAEPEPDEAEEEAPVEEAVPPSMLPETLRLIIEKTIDKLVPLIFEKVTSGGGLGGLPLAAIFDWRKAMPGAQTTAASTPAAAGASAAPAAPYAAPAGPAAPAAATAPHAPHAAPAGPATPAAATVPPAVPAAPASAGAAPSATSPLGAAPAQVAPTGELPPQELTEEEAAAMLNAHILQIWQGLTPPERSRASELISGLTDTQRSAWFAELARLTVPEAIARARGVLRAQPPSAPPTHSLQTATPKGDPSS
jgi:hypothetical protein